MSPFSTVYGGQHDAKYFEEGDIRAVSRTVLHAAFVADKIWGVMLEPARKKFSFSC